MGQYDLVPTLTSRYASTSLFLYDILLTLDDEVTYIWSTKLTGPKALYLWVRYPGFMVQLFSCVLSIFSLSDKPNSRYSRTAVYTEQSCIDYNMFFSTWLFLTSATTDGLLLLRVLALVKGRRGLSVSLRVVYSVVYVTLLVLLAYNYKEWAGDKASWAENLGCIQTMYVGPYSHLQVGNVLVPIASLPVIVLNTIFLIVVLCVVGPSVRRETTSPTLMEALVRDGLVYFIIVAGTTAMMGVTGLIYWNVPRATSLGESWFTAICSMAASRLFLHLRATGANKDLPRPSTTQEDELVIDTTLASSSAGALHSRQLAVIPEEGLD